MPSLPEPHVAAPAGPNRQARRHPEQVQRGFIGIPEAATYLDVTTKTVRRMIARGQLDAFRLGDRLIKIRIADLDALMTPVGGAVMADNVFPTPRRRAASTETSQR